MQHLSTRLIFLILFLIFSSCERCYIKDSSTKTDQWPHAVSYANEHLPKVGKLVQQSDGYAYVKVDDRYIHELFPLLKLDAGFTKPPYFRREDAPGAHISVVYEDENVTLSEAGKEFSFALKNFKLVETKDSTSFLVLEVDAPELEKLREKYGLSKKLKNHEFHITVAKKYPKK